MTTIDPSTSAVEGTSPGLSAYVARPAGSGPWPGVVVVHEAFAVDDVMRRHADRLASAGFLAILPDLFSAGGRSAAWSRRCAPCGPVPAGRGSSPSSTATLTDAGQLRSAFAAFRPALTAGVVREHLLGDRGQRRLELVQHLTQDRDLA